MGSMFNIPSSVIVWHMIDRDNAHTSPIDPPSLSHTLSCSHSPLTHFHSHYHPLSHSLILTLTLSLHSHNPSISHTHTHARTHLHVSVLVCEREILWVKEWVIVWVRVCEREGGSMEDVCVFFISLSCVRWWQRNEGWTLIPLVLKAQNCGWGDFSKSWRVTW